MASLKVNVKSLTEERNKLKEENRWLKRKLDQTEKSQELTQRNLMDLKQSKIEEDDLKNAYESLKIENEKLKNELNNKNGQNELLLHKVDDLEEQLFKYKQVYLRNI